MTRTDAPILAARLAALAEVYDRKLITPAALEAWFDVLKEFPAEHVLSILIGWPKTHGKFPVPADVWKVCNDTAVVERERKAERERRQEYFEEVKSERAREFLADIREKLNQPKRSARTHWHWVLDNHPSGSVGHRFAEEVLAKQVEE